MDDFNEQEMSGSGSSSDSFDEWVVIRGLFREHTNSQLHAHERMEKRASAVASSLYGKISEASDAWGDFEGTPLLRIKQFISSKKVKSTFWYVIPAGVASNESQMTYSEDYTYLEGLRQLYYDEKAAADLAAKGVRAVDNAKGWQSFRASALNKVKIDAVQKSHKVKFQRAAGASFRTHSLTIMLCLL